MADCKNRTIRIGEKVFRDFNMASDYFGCSKEYLIALLLDLIKVSKMLPAESTKNKVATDRFDKYIDDLDDNAPYLFKD